MVYGGGLAISPPSQTRTNYHAAHRSLYIPHMEMVELNSHGIREMTKRNPMNEIFNDVANESTDATLSGMAHPNWPATAATEGDICKACGGTGRGQSGDLPASPYKPPVFLMAFWWNENGDEAAAQWEDVEGVTHTTPIPLTVAQCGEEAIKDHIRDSIREDENGQ